jgi:hypothetical protein
LAEKAHEELRKIRWETAAEKIAAIYRETAPGAPEPELRNAGT